MISPITTIIADDEPLALGRVRAACGASDRIDVVGEATDGEAALALIDRMKPAAAFLDIAMPGLNGIEVTARLRDRIAPPKIVLVTANDHFATAAFDLEVIDYVLKPIDEARMTRAIERLITAVEGSDRKTSGALWVPYRGGIVPLLPDQIERVEAERDYVRIFDSERSYLLRTTLAALDERLGGGFLRIHRSKLIRRDLIAAMKHVGGGRWIVIDRKDKEHPVGRSHLDGLRQGLGA